MSFPALPFLSVPGFLAGGAGTCDYPSEGDVLAGVVYDFGTQTGTLDCIAPPPVPDAPTIQSSPFAAIAIATRDRIALGLDIDPAFVILVANDNYKVTITEPLFCYVRCYQPQVSENLGAGRLARNIERRIRCYLYTRSGEDTYGADDIALGGNAPSQTVATPPVLPGHFVFEEMLLNALDDWPPLDAGGNILTVGPLKAAEDDGPAERDAEDEAGLIRSHIDFIALYVLAENPVDPAP